MIRISFSAAVLASLIFAAPVGAQEVDEAADCVVGGKPVVSEGLPKRPCATQSGVVIRRGPEVTPEPSAVAPDPIVITPVPERKSSGSARSYRSSYGYPLYPTDRYRRSSNFGLVLKSGDVYLRIGNGGVRRGWPYDFDRRDRWRHRDHDRPDKRPGGLSWSF